MTGGTVTRPGPHHNVTSHGSDRAARRTGTEPETRRDRLGDTVALAAAVPPPPSEPEAAVHWQFSQAVVSESATVSDSESENSALLNY